MMFIEFEKLNRMMKFWFIIKKIKKKIDNIKISQQKKLIKIKIKIKKE